MSSLSLKILLAVSLFAWSIPGLAKMNVCGVTINSSDEFKEFKKRLNPRDFNFIELTTIKAKDEKQKSGDEDSDSNSSKFPLENACKQNIHCDVLIISGHFGGNFFGASGLELKLDQMSQASCSQTCSSVLEAPKEVFLFGCNTLAGKSQDFRTPEEYARVLVNDGYSRDEAFRISNLRYGPTGSTFADTMKMIFYRAPRIYGFSSIAPAGATNMDLIRDYLRNVGDYKRHLENLKSSGPNIALKRAFRETSIVEAAGINSQYRGAVCQIQDNLKTLADRAESLEIALGGEQRMAFMTMAEKFVKNQNLEIVTSKSDLDIGDRSSEEENVEGGRDVVVTPNFLRAQAAIQRISQNGIIRDDVRKTLDVSLRDFPDLSISLTQFARSMNWIGKAENRANLTRLLLRKLNSITNDSADFICSNEEAFANLRVSPRYLGPNPMASKDAKSIAGCLNFEPDENFARILWQHWKEKTAANKWFPAKTALVYQIEKLPNFQQLVRDQMLGFDSKYFAKAMVFAVEIPALDKDPAVQAHALDLIRIATSQTMTPDAESLLNRLGNRDSASLIVARGLDYIRKISLQIPADDHLLGRLWIIRAANVATEAQFRKLLEFYYSAKDGKTLWSQGGSIQSLATKNISLQKVLQDYIVSLASNHADVFAMSGTIEFVRTIETPSQELIELILRRLENESKAVYNYTSIFSKTSLSDDQLNRIEKAAVKKNWDSCEAFIAIITTPSVDMQRVRRNWEKLSDEQKSRVISSYAFPKLHGAAAKEIYLLMFSEFDRLYELKAANPKFQFHGEPNVIFAAAAEFIGIDLESRYILKWADKIESSSSVCGHVSQLEPAAAKVLPRALDIMHVCLRRSTDVAEVNSYAGFILKNLDSQDSAAIEAYDRTLAAANDENRESDDDGDH